ncbi:MAG: calcium-translocating P-type ATPase, PMCA-type [Termitinemataceae bacterium]|nr:MAG: calcium-translocating P-type ATPase, PMCA-type [Termitinemataceae bacterium]
MKEFGLSGEQARVSKEKYGDNRMTEQESEGFWDKFKGNLCDPMIKILCFALFINVVFTILGITGVINEGAPEWYESVGIAMAVLIATLVSTFSEHKNENAFQKLQAEASAIKCKVYRDGKIIELPIDDIVKDDCVLLQLGDKIPADGILVDGSIQVDQAALNGESKEAAKTVMPSDYVEHNTAMDFLNPYKVFRGSLVCNGNAVMRVTTIGDGSVYGKIASELQIEDDRDTPLKLKLTKLAGSISKLGYLGGIFIAVALLFQRIVIHNGFDIEQIALYCSNWVVIVQDLIQALMLAVIIIVMAVPEGLPLMIAIVSALNMGKMLKDNVLVRKVAGIETAGSINILFSDKTGTITKGQLETVVFLDGNSKEYKQSNDVTGQLGKLLSLSINHNTNAVLSGSGNDLRIIGGNATERAILSFMAGKGDSAKVSVVKNIPFNSTNKYSASRVEGDYTLTLIKGAPEKLLQRCKYYYDEEGVKQTLASVETINGKIDELAGRAIRVLALATSENDVDGESLPEGDWTLVGIVGIRDEVRPESVTAISEVQSAGVQVVMITGDRKDTAVAIAKEAGLLNTPDAVVLRSDELAAMSDDEIKQMLKKIRVVARALPSDKSRLVRIAQDLNLVVGMTGDGVNDSPALKKADVGFAMGGGSEVAKEASEIVILDDNFNSIDKAILYGRTIFNSIRKFIVFQLTINVSAVIINFIAPLLGQENPLSITQILWINLVMDTLAALAFGGESALKRFMKEAPKQRDEAIVSPYMWSSILTGAVWTTALSGVFLFIVAIKNYFPIVSGNNSSHTGYFAFFVFIAVFNAFNARTDKINLFDNISGNKGFLQILAIIVLVQVLLVYIGGAVFNCYGLSLSQWGIVLLFAFSIIPIDLIRKIVCRDTDLGNK